MTVQITATFMYTSALNYKDKQKEAGLVFLLMTKLTVLFDATNNIQAVTGTFHSTHDSRYSL